MGQSRKCKLLKQNIHPALYFLLLLVAGMCMDVLQLSRSAWALAFHALQAGTSQADEHICVHRNGMLLLPEHVNTKCIHPSAYAMHGLGHMAAVHPPEAGQRMP